MSGEPLLLLPSVAAQRIRTAEVHRGALNCEHDTAEGFVVPRALSVGRDGPMLPLSVPREYMALRRSGSSLSGLWQRVQPDLHLGHLQLQHRAHSAMPLHTFREWCDSAIMPGGGAFLMVTHSPDLPEDLQRYGVPEFAAWYVDGEGASPWAMAVEPDAHGISQLRDRWPVDVLSQRSVLVVGTGSIGGRVAQALAAYGIGSLHLLDPDRLLWHNTVRHVLDARHVGRLKVDALREVLEQRWSGLRVAAHPLDVTTHASTVRALLPNVDLVVCGADGVAPRRVVSHLARRAHVPAVLACVLDDGAVGEALRLRPGPKAGCLLCQRRALAAHGGIDPEADQDAAYGMGTAHRPMTAVGPDLDLVGNLAAKMAVATLLQAHAGAWDQRLPGEHAVIALRPKPGLAPPFDVKPAGAIAWHPATPPLPDCPTCSAP